MLINCPFVRENDVFHQKILFMGLRNRPFSFVLEDWILNLEVEKLAENYLRRRAREQKTN